MEMGILKTYFFNPNPFQKKKNMKKIIKLIMKAFSNKLITLRRFPPIFINIRCERDLVRFNSLK